MTRVIYKAIAPLPLPLPALFFFCYFFDATLPAPLGVARIPAAAPGPVFSAVAANSRLTLFDGGLRRAAGVSFFSFLKKAAKSTVGAMGRGRVSVVLQLQLSALYASFGCPLP